MLLVASVQSPVWEGNREPVASSIRVTGMKKLAVNHHK